ncbi:MAG: hypothetical protein KTR18_02665 [Acidiferrobacterales bacterium]|nr:hypothetical protein [Acidiferrobacterales bacterium]
MKRKSSHWFIQYFLGLSLLAVQPGYACIEQDFLNQAFKVEGRATGSENEFLYSEHLEQIPDQNGGTLKVDYKDINGSLFASKIVTYNCNPTTPSFILRDTRSGNVEGVRWNERDLESFQGDKVVRLDQPSRPAVVDAGFDNVIKLNWDKLMREESVKYDYLFARRNKFLKLRFTRSNPPKALKDKANQNIAFFKVGANNVIFRMLSSPIYVGYDIQSRTLAYYYGPTNLPMLDMDKPILITYTESQPG